MVATDDEIATKVLPSFQVWPVDYLMQTHQHLALTSLILPQG